jgi:hypothetical protein
MKQKLLMKYFLISTLLVAVALCLMGMPFGEVNADPPEPTPSPALDIRTRLQPYQAPGVEPAQSDGRLFEEAPLPSEVEEPPVGALAQQTLYAIADATVLQGYPSENLGDTADMWAGYDEYLEPDGQIARSLVGFDITSLPPNQVITEATLRVYLVNSWDYPDTSRTIRTYRITSSWSESSVTWNNRPGYGSAYGSRSIVSGAWGWYEFDVTDLVGAWYDGTYTNHGIMLRGPEVSGLDASWRGFGTRESSYRPQLIIEYETSNTPPTITGLPDQTLEANTSLDNAIDLWAYTSDAESPDSDLTLTIDNTPDPNAGVSMDSNRYIDINPAPDWTGQTDVTICVTDPGNLSDTDTFSVDISPRVTDTNIYLPIILNNAGSSPPVGPPSAPVLNPINNSDGDGDYTVSWSSVSGATAYVLQEDDNASFTSPTTPYSGANTSQTITDRAAGTYYYRVQATNSLGSSSWSNVVSVQVTQPGVVPQPGYWSGGNVSFEVTPDSSTVHDFTAEVYVSGCGTYSLTSNDIAISNGQFSGGGVSGEFSTPTSASGRHTYFFEACNGWTLVFGSWSATWQYALSN